MKPAVQVQQRHQVQGDDPASAGSSSNANIDQSRKGDMLDRRRTKALIYLRGLDTQAITRATGIQVQNYLSWMNGNNDALSERNKALIAEILGYANGRLESNRVHVWNIDGRNRGSLAKGLEALAAMEGCLAGTTMRILEPATRSGSEKLTGRVIAQALWRETELCVLILYKNRPMKNLCLSDTELKGVVWYDKSRAGSEAIVPNEFRASVLSGNITSKEFEKLYTDGSDMKTWGQAVMVLREMGITPDEVISHAAMGGMFASGQPARPANVLTMGSK